MIPIGKPTAREGEDQKAEGQDQKAEGENQKAEEQHQKAEGQDQKAEGQDQKAKCAYLFCCLKGDDLLGLLNALLSGTAAGHSLCFVGSRLGPLAGAGTQSVLCPCYNVTHSISKTPPGQSETQERLGI